jgi:type III secretory pathway lipoprotein EscJ
MRCIVAFALGLVGAAAACAPTIEGPVERQRTADRADADRLATQLAALPGAVRAEVTLHRPATDPLTDVTTPPSAAVVVVVDDKADRRAVQRSAIALVRGTAPEIREPEIVVELGATRPVLASVGPFTVEAASKPRLVGLLAGAFALVAALAAWIAWRERWRIGSSARRRSARRLAD